MNIWSAAAILEKNKLASDAPFLILAKVVVDGIDEPIRLVRNNEDITWNSNTWQRFPFEMGSVKEDGKDLPSLVLKVSNVKGLVQAYVQKYSGFCDSAVTIYVVHASHLDNTTPEMEMDFVITQTKYDEQWVSFTIGGSLDQKFRFPVWRYMRNFCQFHFGDIQCGYAGTADECDYTSSTCRISKRFGGEPGIPDAT